MVNHLLFITPKRYEGGSEGMKSKYLVIQQLAGIERGLRKTVREKQQLVKAAERRLARFLKARDNAGKEALKVLQQTMQEIKR
jgi:hypothetical protein